MHNTKNIFYAFLLTFVSSYDIRHHRNWFLVNDPVCGRQHHFGGRIIGGENALQGDYPWMARIFSKIQLDNRNVYMDCGGTIINEKYLITADHCVRIKLPHKVGPAVSTKQITVKAGLVKMDRSPKCINEDTYCVTHGVSEVIHHPGYNKSCTDDLALIRIETKFLFNDHVSPICLEYGPAYESTHLGAWAEIAGWGGMENPGQTPEEITPNNALYPNHLQKMVTPILHGEECNFIDSFSNKICAGGQEEKRAFEGDSGGPIMIVQSIYDQSPRYYLIGVYACRLRTTKGNSVESLVHKNYDIYARISSYLPWILDYMYQ